MNVVENKNCTINLLNSNKLSELSESDKLSDSNELPDSNEINDTIKINVPNDVIRLNNLIDNFIDKFKHLPKQKSPEWYKMRTDGMNGIFIGGSDIASAININDYQSPGQLIRAKCSLPTARDSNDPIAMHWGSLFEDVIARFIEIDLQTKVKGTEMMICGHKSFRYSPDGLFVAGLKFTNGALEPCPANDPDCFIVIIFMGEFKSLWARTSKDSVPKYYVPQPLAGLEVIQIAQMALFVEGLFKCCSLEDLNPGKNYSRKIHTRQRFLNKYPISWGMFFVYAEEKEYDDFCKLDIHRDGFNNDIGSYDLETFKMIMKKIDAGTYTTEFCDPKPYSQDAIEKMVDDASNNSGELYLIGVIPWKLFEIKYFLMDRDSEYISKISEQLDMVNEIISKAKTNIRDISDDNKETEMLKLFQEFKICDDIRGVFSSDNRSVGEREFLESVQINLESPTSIMLQSNASTESNDQK